MSRTYSAHLAVTALTRIVTVELQGRPAGSARVIRWCARWGMSRRHAPARKEGSVYQFRTS